MPNSPPVAGSGGAGLRRQRGGPRLGQRAGQAGEDCQVYVQPDAGQATDPQGQHGPLVFEHTEGAPVSTTSPPRRWLSLDIRLRDCVARPAPSELDEHGDGYAPAN